MKSCIIKVDDVKKTIIAKLNLTAIGLQHGFDEREFGFKKYPRRVKLCETSEDESLADIILRPEERVLAYQIHSYARKEYGDTFVTSFLNQLNAAAKQYDFAIKPFENVADED